MIHLVGGLSLFGAADAGDLVDGLHPDPVGGRIGTRFFEQVLHADKAFAGVGAPAPGPPATTERDDRERGGA